MHVTDDEVDQARDEAAQYDYQKSKMDARLFNEQIVRRAAAGQRLAEAAKALAQAQEIDLTARTQQSHLDSQIASVTLNQSSRTLSVADGFISCPIAVVETLEALLRTARNLSEVTANAIGILQTPHDLAESEYWAADMAVRQLVVDSMHASLIRLNCRCVHLDKILAAERAEALGLQSAIQNARTTMGLAAANKGSTIIVSASVPWPDERRIASTSERWRQDIEEMIASDPEKMDDGDVPW